jgi:hypothetical protein
MPNESRLVLIDGSEVSVAEIVRNCSFDLYQTELHYSICQKLAERRSDVVTEQKLLVNIYALKSGLVRTATAVALYVKSNRVTVKTAFLDEQIGELLEESLPGITIVKILEHRQPYIERKYFLLFLAKAVAHRIFRLIHRPQASEILVRAWVEVTEKMYPKEVRSGTLLIYPFALGLKRQIRFIHWCNSNGIRWRFCGLPYPLLSILWGWVSGQPYDRIVSRAELQANDAHGDELVRMRAQEIYTSDEFECGSFAMYEKAVESGIRVVNTAHGVGQYCPYVCYTEFRALSEFQASFYKSRNPGITYSVMSKKKMMSNGLGGYAESSENEVALVLIHQPFEETGLPAEQDAQLWLDSALAEMRLSLGVRYFIKMHPNNRARAGSAEGVQFRGESCYSWRDLNVFRPIFITVNSSAFFDVKGAGVILVYEAPTFMPELYFPEPFLRVGKATLREVISAHIPAENWTAAAAQHAKPASCTNEL